MIRRLVMVAIIVVFCSAYVTAQAATEGDVARVVNLLKSAKSGKFLAFKDYGDGSFQCVYVVNKKRYTAYYNPNPDDGWISFWVRPDGTSGNDFIKTFSDHHFDGVVDFGIQGGVEEKMLNTIALNVGKEHMEYWQALYNEAIADTAKYLN